MAPQCQICRVLTCPWLSLMEVDGATTCSVLVAELATGVLRSFRRRFVKAILSMAPFRARSFIFFRTRNAGVMSTTLPNCRKIYRVPLATAAHSLATDQSARALLSATHDTSIDSAAVAGRLGYVNPMTWGLGVPLAQQL